MLETDVADAVDQCPRFGEKENYIKLADAPDQQHEQDVVLVLAGVHAAAELIARGPEGGVEVGFLQSHRFIDSAAEIVKDFGYVQHLNHFYDIDLIKTSLRILPVSIQSCIPQAFIRPF